MSISTMNDRKHVGCYVLRATSREVSAMFWAKTKRRTSRRYNDASEEAENTQHKIQYSHFLSETYLLYPSRHYSQPSRLQASLQLSFFSHLGLLSRSSTRRARSNRSKTGMLVQLVLDSSSGKVRVCHTAGTRGECSGEDLAWRI
jgi:hypothetical protein